MNLLRPKFLIVFIALSANSGFTSPVRLQKLLQSASVANDCIDDVDDYEEMTEIQQVCKSSPDDVVDEDENDKPLRSFIPQYDGAFDDGEEEMFRKSSRKRMQTTSSGTHPVCEFESLGASLRFRFLKLTQKLLI